MNTFTKSKMQFETIRVTWQEIKSCGTIQDRSYTCKKTDAMWHLMQLRKSPDVIRNVKIER